MNSLRHIIKEHLLLEKRIAQISDSFKISFGYDILTTKHARDRANLGREGISSRVISNATIINIIEKCKRKISEYIINGYIDDSMAFIIKDREFNIDLAIKPQLVEKYYWTLLVITVFPSTEGLGLLFGEDQLVIEV
jgi:hypothetical protein